MSRQLARTLLQAASRTLANPGTQQQAAHQLAPVASWLRGSSLFHTSSSAWAEAPAKSASEVVKGIDSKFGYLADKDIWDEAWAHEPRFGTEDNPIIVPSLLAERIIGVTDPHDDTLVIWGIVREGEPPKQLVAGGEFFTLSRVERIEKVSDKLGIPDPHLS
ncbi:MAG: hypothetical protein J3K34DRAFT_407573 [Monoraphidium minutum]|nr:MAG: hypothetical protein J3K34DRAFT_407573 [Monoraphidium minutum]